MTFDDLSEKEIIGLCYNCSSSYQQNGQIKCREKNPDIAFRNYKLICNNSDICHKCINRGFCTTDCGGWDFIL